MSGDKQYGTMRAKDSSYWSEMSKKARDKETHQVVREQTSRDLVTNSRRSMELAALGHGADGKSLSKDDHEKGKAAWDGMLARERAAREAKQVPVLKSQSFYRDGTPASSVRTHTLKTNMTSEDAMLGAQARVIREEDRTRKEAEEHSRKSQAREYPMTEGEKRFLKSGMAQVQEDAMRTKGQTTEADKYRSEYTKDMANAQEQRRQDHEDGHDTQRPTPSASENRKAQDEYNAHMNKLYPTAASRAKLEAETRTAMNRGAPIAAPHTTAKHQSQGAVETGPRGGKFVRGPGGTKSYVK